MKQGSTLPAIILAQSPFLRLGSGEYGREQIAHSTVAGVATAAQEIAEGGWCAGPGAVKSRIQLLSSQ